MPIYEYACRDCEARFEKLVRRWGESVACPACASGAVEKQLSTFAVSSASGAPTHAGCAAGDGSCGAPICGGGACGLPG